MADSALGGVADLLTKVLPLVTGSKSTSTESMQVDPASNAALQALLGQLTEKSTSTAGSDQILSSLLDKAQLSTVLPAVGQQQQAGLYNGNTLADITARARAKASNDAMATILQAQGQAGQNAAYLAAANAKNNSRSVKTMATPGNPLLQALSLGATGYGLGQKVGLIGTGKDDPIAQLVNTFRGKQASKTAEDIISEGVTKGQMTADGTPLDLSTTDLGIGQSSNAIAPAAGAAADTATSAGAGALLSADASSAALSGSIGSEFAGAGALAAGDTALGAGTAALAAGDAGAGALAAGIGGAADFEFADLLAAFLL